MSDIDSARPQRLPRGQRRAQLLEAALAVFVQKGYHGAAMDDIAAQGGVSKPVLYQHFPGKLELYLALVDRHAAELEELVRNALALQDNRARARTMVEAYYDFVGREGDAFRLIFESDVSSSLEVSARLERMEVACTEAMADIIQSTTDLPHEQAMVAANGLIGLAQSAARYWAAHQDKVDQAAAQDATWALVSRGLNGLGQRPAKA